MSVGQGCIEIVFFTDALYRRFWILNVDADSDAFHVSRSRTYRSACLIEG